MEKGKIAMSFGLLAFFFAIAGARDFAGDKVPLSSASQQRPSASFFERFGSQPQASASAPEDDNLPATIGESSPALTPATATSPKASPSFPAAPAPDETISSPAPAPANGYLPTIPDEGLPIIPINAPAPAPAPSDGHSTSGEHGRREHESFFAKLKAFFHFNFLHHAQKPTEPINPSPSQGSVPPSEGADADGDTDP